VIVAAALDGIITLDHQGQIIAFNPAAQRIFGYRDADVRGRDLGELVLPSPLREHFRHELAQYLATGEGPALGQQLEMTALRADGSQFPIGLAIIRIPTEGPPLFTAFVRDITEHKRLEQRRATKLAVAQVLAQAATAEAALDGILEAVCESLEWDAGTIWEVDRPAQVLRCGRFWHRRTVALPEFEAVSRQYTFAPGIGLAGRVWASGNPAWIPDVVADTNFPRAPIAAKEGLHGAFGFPLLLGREILGVIEFFSNAVQEPDEDLLVMMATVGAHVGQFLDRKRAEEEIRTLNRQLRARLDEMDTLLEILPTGVWIGNPDCSEITGNPAAYQIMGFTPGINVSVTNPQPEVPAGLRIFVNGAEVPPADAPMQQVGRTGKPWYNFEHELLFPNGTRKTVYGSVAPLFDAQGGVRKVIGAYADFTDRKHAEEERLASEQRFARFMQHLPGLAWIKDLHGRYVYANDAAEKAFRKVRAELHGKTDEELFPPETAAQFRANDRRALAGGIQTVETLEHDDGILHHSIVSKFPILGPDGKLALVGGMAIDITDRLQAEAALRAAQEQLQIVTDTMAAPVTRCSRDLRFLWVSKPYADWLGRAAEEIIGHPILDIIGPEAFRLLRPHFEKVLSGQQVKYEDAVEFKGLGRRWVSGVYTPTFDAAGAPDGWVAVVIDIDDRKRMEQALQEADRRKDEFLAMLAHELRNPLAPICNALQILNLPGVNADATRRAREMLDRQVRHLVRLVDDLLDVSRIMRNRIELRKERLDLATVFARAVETARPSIDAQGHHLSVSLPSQPVLLEGDLVRLVQVVSNLLLNAAKYTERPGRIWLSGERDGAEAVIQVRDTGVGIDPRLLPHIFDLFTQAERSLARSQGGLGIGLTVVKHLVEIHGGRVQASSPGPGQGSQFTVRLPALPSTPVKVKAGSESERFRPTNSPRRVLVVDDSVDAAESTAMLLRMLGHQIETVHDGPSVLEAVRGFRPQVVLLDIGLPGMNGYEVAKALRAQSENGALFLVAVTGYGQEEDRRRSREAGFDQHVTKPVELATLQRILAAVE
jgi:PAS domain S-box-containing protein